MAVRPKNLTYPASSSVGNGDVDEEGRRVQGVALAVQQGDVPVAGLEAVEGDRVLPDEVIPDEIVIQHEKSE